MHNFTAERKRRLFQWRLRSLVFAITAVCVYLACWQYTKENGMKQHLADGPWRPWTSDWVINESSPAPFLIRRIERDKGSLFHVRTRYYLCFSGNGWKLWESEAFIHQQCLDEFKKFMGMTRDGDKN